MIALSGVGFVDSSGLRVLVEAISERAEAPAVLRGSSRQVLRLLEISGLMQYLHVRPSTDPIEPMTETRQSGSTDA